MSQYQRILLIADPAMQRTAAFERAAGLCRTTGAALHIGLYLQAPVIGAALQPMETRRRWLDQQVTQLRAQGLSVSAQVVSCKDTGAEIRACVEELQPDLVIKDAERDGHLHRLLLQSLDWKLLRDCPASVLLVRCAEQNLPRRILVAIDVSHGPIIGGDVHDRAIKQALALAIQCQAELHLVHHLGLPDPSSSAYAGLAKDLSHEVVWQVREEIRRRFDATAAAYGVAAECRHLLEDRSSTAEALRRFARQQGFGVLVIGAVQRSRFDRLLMGSTAEAVAETVECDLLAVKPDPVRDALARPVLAHPCPTATAQPHPDPAA